MTGVANYTPDAEPLLRRSEPDRQPKAYLGRQPIYNVVHEIKAYELLHRLSRAETSASFYNGTAASAEVVLQAFLDIGLCRVSPSQPVFINHPASLLTLEPLIPADRCVIEVLEDVPASEEVLSALRRLRKMGYRIALDDFVYSLDRAQLIDYADFVKLDVRALTPEDLEWHVSVLKPLRKSLIAEKVESQEEFERCKAAGCDLFQGYYLRRPEMVTGNRIPSNRLSALSLLTECMVSQWKPIAAVIERDPTLTYGVLQLANSVLHGSARQLRSANEAVVRLGTDRIYHWAALLVLAGHDDCPTGYLEFAIQRAQMTEIIAVHLKMARNDGYLAGLLSTLESVFDAPLEQIIAPLPLQESLIRAILGYEGPLGRVLGAVIHYQSGHTGDMAEDDEIPLDLLQKSYWESAESARHLVRVLESACPRTGSRP